MNMRVYHCPKVNEIPRLLELEKKMGFEFSQTNGQRVFGPPENRKSPPPKGCEVFVGKLPRDLFEDELVPFMEKVGKIYETRLMMDFSGTNRGYAFVLYRNPYDAAKAIKQLNNMEIRVGKPVGVVKSINNCRLFIGGLPKNRTKEEILEVMSDIVDGIKSIILYTHLLDKAKSRGFAFLEFDNHRTAAMARRKLLHHKPKFWGYEVAVDWAEPEFDVDHTVMSKVTNLYVRNLMMRTSEERIMDVFSVAGACTVERVKKIRDFAFVHFPDRKNAELALRLMNGQKLDGAILEVTWAKPINRCTYLMHKTFRRPSTSLRDDSGVPKSILHNSNVVASWLGSYSSRPAHTAINRRADRIEPGCFTPQDNVPGNLAFSEVNSKEGYCLMDPAGIPKEKTDCSEEVSHSMVYYKQVAVTAFPIAAASADPTGYHMVHTTGGNGYDQSLITSGAIQFRGTLVMPPTVLPEAAYAMPSTTAFYMQSAQNIPG